MTHIKVQNPGCDQTPCVHKCPIDQPQDSPTQRDCPIDPDEHPGILRDPTGPTPKIGQKNAAVTARPDSHLHEQHHYAGDPDPPEVSDIRG